MEFPSTKTNVNFQAGFMSKVFLFFGLAIAASAIGCYTAMTMFSDFFLANPMTMYLMFALELILVFTSRLWSQKAPLSYVLFLAFAFITGVTIVPLIAVAAYETGSATIVVKAFLATALMFGASSIFALTTQRNLSGLGGFLFMSIIGMLIVSIVGIFLPWGNTFEMLFSGFGVIVFSGYTMYDVQRLKHYPENQYIDAALQLYLDMFNLFVYILRLILAFNRD